MRKIWSGRACLAAIMIAVTSFGSLAYAGTSGPGVFVDLVGQSSMLFFATNGARTSPPACATVPDRWAIDTTTSGGQALASLILSAQAQGRTISVYGTGTCPVWGDKETVSYVDIPTI